ncbi:PREDICTED: cytochrome P450 2G1-like [Priapulus caudatus]|uniref:Cytochrome P450 2G1-like n=1 Tax=Priapulus caudatus TaxID=37621 RepID=A0ABM1F520_PRICU|nr:PREDICTED: cytochrome P450 2G1-like [Priapulus caudatus]
MGPQFAVVLNTVDLAREAFKQQGEVTSGRNYHFLLARYLGDENEVFHGISFNEGKRWKEQRKFALSKLREFGMGKVSIEKKIQEEASICLAHLSDTKGEPFDPQTLLNNVVINVIASIEFGKRYDYDDPAFHKLVSDINELFLDIDLQGIINYYPWLRHLPAFKRFIKKLDTGFAGVQREILGQHVAEHERRYAPPCENDADFNLDALPGHGRQAAARARRRRHVFYGPSTGKGLNGFVFRWIAHRHDDDTLGSAFQCLTIP